MSKDRARRRAARTAEVAARTAERERKERRRRRRRRLFAALARPWRRRGRGGLLDAKRRRQNGLIAGCFVFVEAVIWYLADAWLARLVALLLGLFLLPVAVTLILDRRRP